MSMGGKRVADPQDEGDAGEDATVRERDLVEAYVQEHALETALNEAINQVVAARPEDPFLVLSALLYGKATARRGIFHVECREIIDGMGLPGVLVRLHTGKGVFEATSGSQVAGRPDRPESFDEFAPTVPVQKQRFGGQGYRLRAEKAQAMLVESLVNLEPTDQQAIDAALRLVEADIGRNFCLAASIAACKAGARYAELPLHEYISKLSELPLENVCIPMPLFSLINAGKLASNKLFVQEIFVAPVSATSFADAFQLGVELSRSVRDQLESRGVGFSNLGSFGGYAPQLQTIAETFQILRSAIEETRARIESSANPSALLLDNASVTPLRFEFGIDFAASAFVMPLPPPPPTADDTETIEEARTTFTYDTDKWVPGSSGVIKSSDEMLEMIQSCIKELDVATVVDPFDGGDIKAFAALLAGDSDAPTDESGGEAPGEATGGQRLALGGDPDCRLQVVARDLVDAHGLEALHEERAANTILLQLEQVSTVTKALEMVAEARRYGLAVMLGATPGDASTETAGFLVAFAIGTGISQVKFGGLAASACVDRYNRLLLASQDAVPPIFVASSYRR